MDAPRSKRRWRATADGWKDKSQIPILNVTVKPGLPTNRTELLKLDAACNTVAVTKTELSHEDYAQFTLSVHFQMHHPAFERLWSINPRLTIYGLNVALLSFQSDLNQSEGRTF